MNKNIYRGGSKSFTTEQFIEKAQKIHGEKYDYSKVKYINAKTRVCIICPIHGEFWQTPDKHLSKRGCPLCGIEQSHDKTRFDTEQFILKAKQIHGDKYDYSKVEYKNCYTEVTIICSIHGEFKIIPDRHLQGCGCKQCKYETISKKLSKTTEYFIEQAKLVHGNKYDYSKVIYKKSREKVCIICPIHGEFWQTPLNHVHGNGCPICKESRLERIMSVFLENKIKFERFKKFQWLGKQSLDFYFPEYNVAIECQGEQHFYGWHKEKESLEKIQERDENKRRLCEEHGVKLLYYSDLGIDYPYHVFENLEEIFKEITKE